MVVITLEIQKLEAKIDELINLCEELERKHATLEQDRTRLLEKNELAKSKVEAMIMRLKALEQE